MLKLKALLLTQGMHGMISQVEGLANALSLSFKHEKIQLKNIWKFSKIDQIMKTANSNFKEIQNFKKL